jgi:hypothetical protein
LNYDARGQLRASAELDERARVTLSLGRDTLIVGARGGVYRWDGYAAVTRVGRFGRPVLDAVLDRGGSIIGLLPEDELAALSLSSAELTPLSSHASSAGSNLRRGVERESWVTPVASASLMLLRFAGDAPREAAVPELSSASLHWLAGADHALATISASTPLTFHRSDGAPEVTKLRCADPLSLIPAGSGRIALGCRSGNLWLVGENTSPAAAPSRPRATEQ